MDFVRTGVVGVGNMGTAHATTLYENRIHGMKLAAVCDVAEDRLRYCSEHFQNVPQFRDYHEMIRSGLLDALIVAVPHRLHSVIASESLDAGLHTLTEKPEDVMTSRARSLNRHAEDSGKVFAIMFNQRTNAVFQRAREIVQSGQLGELKRSVWVITNWYRTQHYYDSGAWRATWAGEGGGVLLNQAPHNLDLWQWICGMPVSVTAYCDEARYHHIEVEDDATIFTRYANGATGIFITSTGEYPGTNRLEISGEKGKLVLEGGKIHWWRLKTSEREIRFQSPDSFARIETEYEEIEPVSVPGAHAAILQNFANAILHGESLISPGREGINELTISNAAYLSQWTGNSTIRLPLDEELFDAELEKRSRQSVFREKKETENPDGLYSNRWQVNW